MLSTPSRPSPVLPPPNPPTLSFPQLQARIRALAQRPARDAQSAFFLEGLRSFIQAHDAGFQFQAIVHSPILLHGSLADMLARRLHNAGVPRCKITPEQFRSLSLAARASGLGAIVRQRWHPLAQPRPGLCHLVVEQIRSPGNLGTLLRTAQAAGAASVIFVGNLSDPYHPAAVRASMGGIFHLPLIRASHAAFAQWVRRHHIRLAALTPDAPTLWTDLPASTPQSPLALVLGEERQGVSPFLQSLCTAAVRLPMPGHADSLNVSIAAAVMLYELLRRTPAPSSPRHVAHSPTTPTLDPSPAASPSLPPQFRSPLPPPPAPAH